MMMTPLSQRIHEAAAILQSRNDRESQLLLASALGTLAEKVRNRGATRDSLSLLDRAVAILREGATTLDGLTEHLAGALNNSGNTKLTLGLYADATVSFQEAAELLRRTISNPKIKQPEHCLQF